MIDDLFFIFGLNQLVRESLKKKRKKTFVEISLECGKVITKFWRENGKFHSAYWERIKVLPHKVSS